MQADCLTMASHEDMVEKMALAGFKSVFLSEILANIGSTEVVFEMSDPSKAGIMLPFESDSENEDVLMLLMPMMVNN